MGFLPFGLTLAGLTLKGKQREISKAHHELIGIALERRILEIEIEDQDECQKKLHLLDKRHGIMSPEEYDIKIMKMDFSDKELEMELLKISRKYEHMTEEEFDFTYAEMKYTGSKEKTDLPFIRLQLEKKYGRLTEKQFDKAVYSLGNRPWVDVIHSEYKEEHGTDGFMFELDWNDAFVNLLRTEGYGGATDEEIVENWFEDKSTDQYLGLLSEQLEEMGADLGDAQPFKAEGTRKTVKEQLKDKKTKHS